MINMTKLLIKLKKRKHYFAINLATHTYLNLTKDKYSAFKQVIKFLTPNRARALLYSFKTQVSPHEFNLLKNEIDTFDQHITIKPSKRLKIAVCLSGEPRSYIHCIDSFKRFFSGHDIDIYISNKDSRLTDDVKSLYKAVFESNYSEPSFHNLEKKGFKKFGFQPESDGLIIANANPNIYPMWYGIYKSAEYLINNPEISSKYDAICRCRFDTFFIKPMDIENFPENSIFIDPNYNEHDGYSDQFAIGSPSAMMKYFNLYSWIEDSLDLDYGKKGYLPERVLKKYLQEHCKINVQSHEFETRLLRDEFIGLPSYKIPLKNFTFSKDRNIRLNQYIKEKHPDLYPGN